MTGRIIAFGSGTCRRLVSFVPMTLLFLNTYFFPFHFLFFLLFLLPSLPPSLTCLRLTESNFVAEYNLEPLISLPPLSESCDYVHPPPYLVYTGLRLEPGTLVFGVCGIWV